MTASAIPRRETGVAPPSRWRRHAATAIGLALVALTGSPSPAGPATPAADAVGSSRDPYARLLRASRDLGPTQAGRQVALSLALVDRGGDRRAADIQRLYDPSSPEFGQYRSAAQLDAAYGPDAALSTAVSDYLRDAGLGVEWPPGRSWVGVHGAVRDVERTFGITVHDFVSPKGQRFYAGLTQPRVPAQLLAMTSGATPVTDYQSNHLFAVPSGGLKPIDVALAYNTKPLRDLNIDGRGQTVTLWALGDSFKQSDLDAFNAKYHLPAITPKVHGPPAESLKSEGEIIMDIEVVHAIAPGASILVDTTQVRTNGDVLNAQAGLVEESQGGIISQSWGGCDKSHDDASVSADKQIYDRADQLGESVLVSTGDTGAYECLTADWGAPPRDELLGVPLPAAVPGVTAVGGTRIGVRQDGTWSNEAVWEHPASGEGGGGGLSANYPMPLWQKGPGVQNRYSNGMRQIPDVSADADSSSGMAILSNGSDSQGGGTSQAAPMWAGFTALIDQYLTSRGKHRVGFMNPALYAIAAGGFTYPGFHDITVGGNLYYPATPGYDLATGLGTPDVWNLARDFEQYQAGGGS